MKLSDFTHVKCGVGGVFVIECTATLPRRVWKKSQELTGVAPLYRPLALIAAPASPAFSGLGGPSPGSDGLGQQHICLTSLPVALQKQNSRPGLGGKNRK